MGIIHSSFQRAEGLYEAWFAEWFHVHFFIRTVMVLLSMWLLVFLAAQLLRFVVMPCLLMFYYHVILRAWNFLFVETPHEWIYIKYHSQDNPKFGETYMRLCDKVKRNRYLLSHTKYRGLVLKLRRPVAGFMVLCAVAVTFWAVAFGLHVEYVVPVSAVADAGGYENGRVNGGISGGIVNNNEISGYYTNGDEPTGEQPTENRTSTIEWRENSVFMLSPQGRTGARLHSGPGIEGHMVIEILWDDAALFYLNEYVADDLVRGKYWLLVETQNGMAGYISSHFVEVYM